MSGATIRLPAYAALILFVVLSPLLLTKVNAYPIITDVDESFTKVRVQHVVCRVMLCEMPFTVLK